MKNIVYTFFIVLIAGCQSGSSSSSPQSETIIQEKKTDSAPDEKKTPRIKDMGELLYENMIGKDFAMSHFKTIEGEELTTSFLRGKVVFLNFWFKNCSPCMAEMEGLNQLYEKYKSDNSVFLMITFEDLKVIQEVKKKYGLPFKMIRVERDEILSWGISGYPSSFILNNKGVITYARAGGQGEIEKATIEVLTYFGSEIETQLNSLN